MPAEGADRKILSGLPTKLAAILFYVERCQHVPRYIHHHYPPPISGQPKNLSSGLSS